MPVDIGTIQLIFLTALAQTFRIIYRDFRLLQDMACSILGVTRQTVAGVLNGTRTSLTQQQGQAFCFWMSQIELRCPEWKIYLHVTFSSCLPVDVSPELFEGNWMDIWFRLFPAPVPTEVDLKRLPFSSPEPQIILDPLLLAEPGILAALEPLTASMKERNSFYQMAGQKGSLHYKISLRSLQLLEQDPPSEERDTALRAINSLGSSGVLTVSSDPENVPADPDEALLQGVKQLCRFVPVMVMTNLEHTAVSLQQFYRKNTPPFQVRAVRFERNRFIDWPEPSLEKLLSESRSGGKEPKLAYQTESWNTLKDPKFE